MCLGSVVASANTVVHQRLGISVPKGQQQSSHAMGSPPEEDGTAKPATVDVYKSGSQESESLGFSKTHRTDTSSRKGHQALAMGLPVSSESTALSQSTRGKGRPRRAGRETAVAVIMCVCLCQPVKTPSQWSLAIPLRQQPASGRIIKRSIRVSTRHPSQRHSVKTTRGKGGP